MQENKANVESKTLWIGDL